MEAKNPVQSEDFLVDSYGLAYLHSRELQDLLPLILYKFKIHVSVFSIYEFLSFFYYKLHNSSMVEDIANTIYKFYIVENVEKETIVRAAMILTDLVKHGTIPDSIDVINTAVALSRNIPVLSTQPERYSLFAKYGLTVLSIEDFVRSFKKDLIELE